MSALGQERRIAAVCHISAYSERPIQTGLFALSWGHNFRPVILPGFSSSLPLGHSEKPADALEDHEHHDRKGEGCQDFDAETVQAIHRLCLVPMLPPTLLERGYCILARFRASMCWRAMFVAIVSQVPHPFYAGRLSLIARERTFRARSRSAVERLQHKRLFHHKRHRRLGIDSCGAGRSQDLGHTENRPVIGKEDATDDPAVGQHVVVVVRPLAARIAHGCAFEDQGVRHSRF